MRTPDTPPPPPVAQRLRVRYAKRGKLRFTSHRDVARALERAIRRADLPIAFSAGFTPHPKVSYLGAAPTGVASEAEYVEIGLAEPRDPEEVRLALDASLPPGIDVLEVVVAREGSGSFADRIDTSHWQVRLRGVPPSRLADALHAFLAASEVPVERVTKDGRKTLDARAAVVRAAVVGAGNTGSTDVATPGDRDDCAILDIVVRHGTPAVRPDDVLAGLRAVAALEWITPPESVRLAQGRRADDGELLDPLAADRVP